MSDINGRREKTCEKGLVTYLDSIRIEASQIVTMPNGSSHSLDETSNEVLQKKNHLTLLIFFA